MKTKSIQYYRSLILLLVPPALFIALVLMFRTHPQVSLIMGSPPWQFIILAISGLIATIGGVLDWRFHRDPLKLKISKKEREAEAKALGLGGTSMFILMWLAMISKTPSVYLVPIIIVLIYTVVAICYDEFVFHINRCGKEETIYHRMLVFGNGIAWLAWFHFIYC